MSSLKAQPSDKYMRVQDFELLTVEYFQAKEIRALIFDLDDTLVPEFKGRLSEEMVHWLKMLDSAGFKISILTNNFRQSYCQKIIDQLYQEGLHFWVVIDAFKPFPFNFKAVQERLALEPKHIALIGDGVLTDRLGARLMGFQFYHAKWFPVPFHKRSYWLVLREFIIILTDWLRFLVLRHRSHIVEMNPPEGHTTDQPQGDVMTPEQLRQEVLEP